MGRRADAAPPANSPVAAPTVVLHGEAAAESARLLEPSSPKLAPSSPKATKKAGGFTHVLKIIVYCGAYLAIGPTLILVNRSIMREHGFHYPMALSGLGLIFSSIVSFALVHCCHVVQLAQSKRVTFEFYTRNMVPIGAAMAATLAAGNAVYIYLPVGFIQMLKAFTPTVTLLIAWALSIEIPSYATIGSVACICIGTALASIGEASLNPIGLSLMLAAEVAEATRLVLTQKLLSNLKFGVVEGQYYMAPISALWLFSAAAFWELPRAMRTDAMSVPLAHPWLFMLSATLGIAVNFCTFLVIKATSSVTLKVLGTARNAGLVLWSACMLSEKVTPLELAGYSLSLVAFAAYNYFKLKRI